MRRAVTGRQSRSATVHAHRSQSPTRVFVRAGSLGERVSAASGSKEGPRMPKDFLGREVVTAAEISQMAPTERRAHFESSIVTDLSQVPQAFLDRIRARLEPLVAERDREQATSARGPHSDR